MNTGVYTVMITDTDGAHHMYVIEADDVPEAKYRAYITHGSAIPFKDLKIEIVESIS